MTDGSPGLSVTRSTPASRAGAVAALVLVGVLITGPYWLSRADARLMVEVFYFLALAQMWNLLAGYGGLVSVGQQAFLGLGGYLLFILAIHFGIGALWTVPLAGLIEAGANAEKDSGDADQQKRRRHRQRIDVLVIDAHQLRGFGVVRSGAKGAPQPGAVEYRLHRCDHRYGDDEDDQRKEPDLETVGDADARGLDRSGGQPLRVRGKDLQQQILKDDRQTERDQQRRQEVVSQRVVENSPLQQVPREKHDRKDRDHADERIHAGRLDDHHGDEGGQHDQIAVRYVHQPHDPEDDGEPGREHGVEAARENAVDDRARPVDHAPRPKYASTIRSRLKSDGRPVNATRPSRKQ